MKCSLCQTIFDKYGTFEWLNPRLCKCHMIGHTDKCKSRWFRVTARHHVYYCECTD